MRILCSKISICSDAMSEHEPVMVKELLEAMNIDEDGWYIDATYGRGGHSAAVLARLSDKGRLIAYDKDLEAEKHAKLYWTDDVRFEFRRESHANLEQLLKKSRIRQKISGIFFDLGVSSSQIKTKERGFSFNLDGPLDMRMDTTIGITAAQWLNRASVEEIEYVLRFYGEEPYAKRIARAIICGRPLLTTKQLVRTIAGLAGRKHHPATCTFLAIRLFINQELEDLSKALNSVLDLLKSGGRLAVIAFHSLEDRIVKQFITKHSDVPATVRGLPSPEGTEPIKMRRINRLIRPSDKEVKRNPRSRSARLRVAEKL